MTTYYVGKLVTVDGVHGIVYQTSPCVKIVTVKETTAIWCEYVDYEKTGATDADDGAKNMAVLKALGLNKYPAAKWCADLGEGWYLPAKNELVDIYDKKDYLNNLIPGDGLRVLEPVDDAATVNWGNNWRMPTKEELYELVDFLMHKDVYWDYKRVELNGVMGILYTDEINDDYL